MIEQRGRPYWARFTDGEGGWVARAGHAAGPPPGEDLAALRRGLGRAPGSVPNMWRFYVTTIDESRLSGWSDTFEPPPALAAEHHALTLYAIHQQSNARPMHRRGQGLGTALLHLRRTGAFSEEALDRRVIAAATATSVDELAVHLRGLVRQLRTASHGISLDYDQLWVDLTRYSSARRRGAVRRRWGAQYFDWSASVAGQPAQTDSTASEGDQP